MVSISSSNFCSNSESIREDEAGGERRGDGVRFAVSEAGTGLECPLSSALVPILGNGLGSILPITCAFNV